MASSGPSVRNCGEGGLEPRILVGRLQEAPGLMAHLGFAWHFAVHGGQGKQGHEGKWAKAVAD